MYCEFIIMNFWRMSSRIFMILIFLTIIAGCATTTTTVRSANPNIIMTAGVQQNGSYTKNLVDVENKYLVTLKITNNGSEIAKNVKIDHFSYCNNQVSFAHVCINDTLNIGDLRPSETVIRYKNFERSGYLPIFSEKYQLDFEASSEYALSSST